MSKEKKIFDLYLNNKQDNYLNYSLITEELQSIQRSITLLPKDSSKIIHSELVRSSNITKKGQRF